MIYKPLSINDMTRRILIISCLLAIISCQRGGGDAIKIPDHSMIVTDEGVSLISRGVEIIKPSGDHLVEVVMESVKDRSAVLTLTNAGVTPVITRKGGDVTVSYEGLMADGIRYNVPVRLTFSVSKNRDAFVVRPYIYNGEVDYVITHFTGPILKGLQTTLDDCDLLLPIGLGEKWLSLPEGMKEDVYHSRTGHRSWMWDENSNEYRLVLSRMYPSTGETMQWYAFDFGDRGLCIMDEDPDFEAKNCVVSYSPKSRSMSLSYTDLLTCFGGDDEALPPFVVYPYSGDWHVAADYYRAWYNTVRSPIVQPEWAKGLSGWLLAILKQQNDEVIWPYNSLSTDLAKAAKDRGIDVVGLFGWHHGGHDRFYPDYHPDTLLGGKDELIVGLNGLKDQGVHPVMYFNGQLIDQNGTRYWPDSAKYVAIVNKDGSFATESYHKYKTTVGRTFGLGCSLSKTWENRLLNLAKMAESFGADGIIYDQLAVRTPTWCYSPDHGHPVPALASAKSRTEMLERIRDEMRKINPDFIVMTEGFCDAEMHVINMFHGWGPAVFKPSRAEANAMAAGEGNSILFPEMVRYTFPELATTIRDSSPMSDSLSLGYSSVYGLMEEIEARYKPDVWCVVDDKPVKAEDYSTVMGPPGGHNYVLNPFDSRVYTKQVMDLRRKHEDLFITGRFTDNKGFSISSPSKYLIAKSFTNEDRMGVVVWNTSGGQSAMYQFDAPGYKLIEIDSPEGTLSLGDEIKPNGLHFIIFEKN